MIHQIVNDRKLGWNHHNTIYLASEIVSDFGEILEECSWMIFGAPESLLPTSKEEIKIALEVLFRFLKNKDEWDNFRERNPKIAKFILSNNFY